MKLLGIFYFLYFFNDFKLQIRLNCYFQLLFAQITLNRDNIDIIVSSVAKKSKIEKLDMDANNSFLRLFFFANDLIYTH